MEDPTNTQAEQRCTTETAATQPPSSDEQSYRDELKEASQQFFNTLLRAGAHLAMTSVSQLPEESRERFINAGSDFTRSVAKIAHELANTLDTIVEEVKTDAKRNE